MLALIPLLAMTGAAAPVAVRPLIFAHRGASEERPEHTLGGYRLAMEQGADYIEPDLRRTRDGVFIALHDATLNRTTDVADRPELAALARVDTNGVKRWYPEDLTLEQVRTLRTRQSHPKRSHACDLQEPVPTLEEVVALARAFNREHPGRSVGLVPELRGHAAAFVQFVRDHELEADGAPPLYLQSFELGTLKAAAAELRAPCAWLVGKPPTAEQLAALKGIIDAIAIERGAVLAGGAAEWIRAMHGRGFAVIAWTFAADAFDAARFSGADEELGLAISNGVDAVFTDSPGPAVRLRAACGLPQP